MSAALAVGLGAAAGAAPALGAAAGRLTKAGRSHQQQLNAAMSRLSSNKYGKGAAELRQGAGAQKRLLQSQEAELMNKSRHMDPRTKMAAMAANAQMMGQGLAQHGGQQAAVSSMEAARDRAADQNMVAQRAAENSKLISQGVEGAIQGAGLGKVADEKGVMAMLETAYGMQGNA